VEIATKLRADAAALLGDGRVKLVIGYAARGARRVPVFISEAPKVEVLMWDATCRQNLAAYLSKPDLKTLRPVAIVASPPVMRSLVVLASEAQIEDGSVVILGLDESGYHGILDLGKTVELLNAVCKGQGLDREILGRLEQIRGMSPQERAAFWASEFAKCTRCYACRAACPACYCARCIVEKNVPQWISTAAAAHGNFAWNIIRAFHVAGRCTSCGACQAACPQGIPLMLLNVGVTESVETEFGIRAGFDPDAKPAIGSYSLEDKEDFIR